MIKHAWLALAAVGQLASIAPAIAQVTARQGSLEEAKQPEARIEVPSPMVVEVKLPSWSARLRTSTSWSTRDTDRFVCDRARVARLQITRTPRPLGGVTGTQARKWPAGAVMEMEVAPTLSTAWFRQDIDLTIAVLAADGSTVATKTWDDLTIGRDSAASSLGVWGSATSRTPKLAVPLTNALMELFEKAAPTVKVVVAIQSGEEDDEDEKQED